MNKIEEIPAEKKKIKMKKITKYQTRK